MATGQAPLLAPYPSGFPAALVAGGAINVRFFIPGKPIHKDRPRVKMVPPTGRQHSPKGPPCGHAQFYTPKATEDYEKHVGEHALHQLRTVPVEGDQLYLPIQDSRLLLQLRFNLPRPVSVKRKYPTVKPDIDNLVKAILDGLVKHLVIQDDAPITDMVTMKRYANADHPEGVEVDLTALPV